MADTDVISALPEERSDLSGEIAAIERHLEQLHSDFRAVDQVLRQMVATRYLSFHQEGYAHEICGFCDMRRRGWFWMV